MGKNKRDTAGNWVLKDIFIACASTQFTIQLYTKAANEFSAKLSNANENIVWSKTNITAPEFKYPG